jgi:hypothetical protein
VPTPEAREKRLRQIETAQDQLRDDIRESERLIERSRELLQRSEKARLPDG